MKKVWKYGITSILVLVILGGGCYFAIQKNKKPHVTYMANWTNQQNSFEEAYSNATQVIYAKVTDLESYLYNDFPFTEATVEVLDTLKGDLRVGNTCRIRFSGGVIDGVIHEIPPLVIPEIADTCLFALQDFTLNHEVVPGKFVPMGGYQGVLKMDTSGLKRIFGASGAEESVQVVDFNEENLLETELKGKTLEEIKEIVQ